MAVRVVETTDTSNSLHQMSHFDNLHVLKKHRYLREEPTEEKQ